MDVESDPVARELVGDRAGAASQPVVGGERGVVELCGYAVAKQVWQLEFKDAPKATGAPVPVIAQGRAKGKLVDEVHLYTSKSFDQWLEIPQDSVRAQRGNVADLGGRSQIWVDDDVTVKQCRLTTAADVAQSLTSGMDDPTALPGKKSIGGG